MNRIIIIGGGFSGLAAAKRISRSGLEFDAALIDKKQNSDFLPTMPDCIGRGIDPQYLSYAIRDAAKNTGFKFINEEVISVDLKARRVFTPRAGLQYDFLIIASGSETNFYGSDNIKRYACKLDDARDLRTIIAKIKENEFENYIICGGGYTGVEIASNLRVFLRKSKRGGRIITIERAPSILGPLPGWMKKYVSDNLRSLDVDVASDSQIEKIDGETVHVSGARVFNRALVIWAAGVKAAEFTRNLEAERNPQGRIKTDKYLRLDEHCFIAGDAAYFSYKGVYLRMAVQFAMAQGDCAGRNVINSIKGRRLHEYKSLDLGYIIPMANNLSCGTIMGLNLRGFLPTLLHFMMCIYRSSGWKNKLGIIKGLIKGGG